MSELLDIRAAEYHAIKALSAGMVWTFDSECAAKAYIESPWNQVREPVNATHFDIGTALHLAVLEPNLIFERVVAHGFDEYRTNAAKEAREAAYAEGKTPLKPAEWAVVEGMQRVIRGHGVAAGLLTGGTAEATLTWEWDGMMCKCRPDYLASDFSYILDLKSANTANPRAIARKAFNEGWFLRAAWYMNGTQQVTGTLPARYLFIVAEKDAPHLVEIYELDERALVLGERIIQRTLPLIGKCLREDTWPGYGAGGVTTLMLPSWQMAERAEEFEG